MKHPQEHKADQIAKAAKEYVKWYKTKRKSANVYAKQKKAAQIAFKYNIRELFFIKLVVTEKAWF